MSGYSTNADLLRKAHIEFAQNRRISTYTAAQLMARGFMVERLEEKWDAQQPPARDA